MLKYAGYSDEDVARLLASQSWDAAVLPSHKVASIIRAILILLFYSHRLFLFMLVLLVDRVITPAMIESAFLGCVAKIVKEQKSSETKVIYAATPKS